MSMGANSGSGIWWDSDTPAVWLGAPSPDLSQPEHDGDGDASGRDTDT